MRSRPVERFRRLILESNSASRTRGFVMPSSNRNKTCRYAYFTPVKGLFFQIVRNRGVGISDVVQLQSPFEEFFFG